MVSKDDHFYYTQEMRYLSQEGVRFAEKHPDIARQLGLEDVKAELRDPHSERILEGFAFLTGRIRKMLDRQYPELAHALFNLVFPNYLRPVPSKTVCQFSSQEGMLDKPQVIPRGSEIRGKNKEIELIFSTSHEVLLQPIELKRLYVDPEVKADFSLSAELKLHSGVDAGVLDYDAIEFFIHGDPGIRFELFRQFSSELDSIRIKGLKVPDGQVTLDWIGFHPNRSFFEDEDETYLPLHVLRDYFDHPERYLFFKLNGLNEALAPMLDDLTSFQIDFCFKRPFAAGSFFKAENLLLHACSCQNAFRIAAEPMDINGEQLDYRLVPDIRQPEMEVLAVEKVLISKDRVQHHVQPYYHFDRKTKQLEEHVFYALRREPSEYGGWESFIRLFQLRQEGTLPLVGYTASTQILACQGHLARSLKIGQLNELDRALPETIQVRNVTQVSVPCWPPIYHQADWAFIAHLALNYKDIHDVDALKELLGLYNFSQAETINRKIDGILALSRKRDYIVQTGRVVNGFTLVLTCDEDKFQHRGDVLMFGHVLSEFLKAFCPFNSFLRLQLEVGHQEQIFDRVVTG